MILKKVEEIINKLNKEIYLIDLIISDIFNYMKKITQINLPQKEDTFIGKFIHYDNLDQRISFLKNINSLSEKKYQINLQHIKELWNVLVNNSLTNCEQAIFFNFLTNNSKSKTDLSTYNLNDHLYKSILNILFYDKEIMNDYKDLKLETFYFIQEIWDLVNLKENNFELNDKKRKKIDKFDKLIAIDLFWIIFIKTNEKKVIRQSQIKIINIHSDLSDNYNLDQKALVWNTFANQCIKLLSINTNTSQIFLLVNLMKQFILK